MLFLKTNKPNNYLRVASIGIAASAFLAAPAFAEGVNDSWQSPEDISYLMSLEAMAVDMHLETLAEDSAIKLFAAPDRSQVILTVANQDIAACYELASLTEAAPLPGAVQTDASQMSDDYFAAIASCHVDAMGSVVE